MNGADWTVDNLRATLLAVPAVELKGMALLKDRRPTDGFFPAGIPRETLIEAVTEITAYTERSQAAAAALAQLPPVPLHAQAVLEYGL